MDQIQDEKLKKQLQENLGQMGLTEVLTFMIDFLAAFSTEELLDFREKAKMGGDLQNKDEILLMIEEILRLREKGM